MRCFIRKYYCIILRKVNFDKNMVKYYMRKDGPTFFGILRVLNTKESGGSLCSYNQ